MTNPVLTFFEKIVHLFERDAPKLESLIRPEVDRLEALAKKFETLDLTSSKTAILTAVAAGTPVNNVISAGIVAVKTAARSQGVAIADDEAELLSQALTKNVVGTVNAATAAATAPATVAASPAAVEGSPAPAATAEETGPSASV